MRTLNEKIDDCVALLEGNSLLKKCNFALLNNRGYFLYSTYSSKAYKRKLVDYLGGIKSMLNTLSFIRVQAKNEFEHSSDFSLIFHGNNFFSFIIVSREEIEEGEIKQIIEDLKLIIRD